MPKANETLYERMRRRAEAMTLDDVRRALKCAGIVDENGELAAKYLPPEDRKP